MKQIAPTLRYDARVMGDFEVPIGRAREDHGSDPGRRGAARRSPRCRRPTPAIAAAIPGAEHSILEGQTHNVAPAALRPELVEVLRMSTVADLQAAVDRHHRRRAARRDDEAVPRHPGLVRRRSADHRPQAGEGAPERVCSSRGRRSRMRPARWSRRARSSWPRSSSRAPADLDEAALRSWVRAAGEDAAGPRRALAADPVATAAWDEARLQPPQGARARDHRGEGRRDPRSSRRQGDRDAARRRLTSLRSHEPRRTPAPRHRGHGALAVRTRRATRCPAHAGDLPRRHLARVWSRRRPSPLRRRTARAGRSARRR